ncbi:hypothetical protein Pint_06315 [Pistacia integerrima]|uniref:Uncharacterized protein n=1 Tax=Pistacia integerrima TaxID=434235 RepID=A0ACC0Z0R2_9ROSI|nr:hypothetical protein Pint_06315 [Pistacia integerrima]
MSIFFMFDWTYRKPVGLTLKYPNLNQNSKTYQRKEKKTLQPFSSTAAPQPPLLQSSSQQLHSPSFFDFSNGNGGVTAAAVTAASLTHGNSGSGGSESRRQLVTSGAARSHSQADTKHGGDLLSRRHPTTAGEVSKLLIFELDIIRKS